MEKHPLVSIVTPTFNHEKFIEQCIESVLSQTYPHWEQVIIDDGSTDMTGDIAADYTDDRITYIRQDNAGIWSLGKTYNRALEISKGELIAVLEGDDFWPPGKLEKQVPSFDNEDIVLSWGKAACVDSKGEPLWIAPNDLKWFENATWPDMFRRLFLDDYIPACTAMCRKNSLLSIGGFQQTDYTPSVDYPTWLELSPLGSFRFINELLGYWRFHEHQVSSTMIIQIAEGTKYSIDFFKRMPRELSDTVGVTLAELSDNHRRQIAIATFHAGRIALISRRWEEAKQNFKNVLSGDSPSSTRLRALLGLTCAYCRVDMEWIARSTGRPYYKI